MEADSLINRGDDELLGRDQRTGRVEGDETNRAERRRMVSSLCMYTTGMSGAGVKDSEEEENRRGKQKRGMRPNLGTFIYT